MDMTRNFTGTSTSTGSIPFQQQTIGFFDGGEQMTELYVADVERKTFDVQITGAATVVIEGNGFDDDDAADWYQLSSTTSSSHYSTADAHKYVRARVSSFTSGSVTVNFFGND